MVKIYGQVITDKKPTQRVLCDKNLRFHECRQTKISYSAVLSSDKFYGTVFPEAHIVSYYHTCMTRQIKVSCVYVIVGGYLLSKSRRSSYWVLEVCNAGSRISNKDHSFVN